MAEHVLPYPEPRPQLRTEPARHTAHDDKYVSVFQSGIPDVDLTFRDPILSQSADHFKVGIDELTVSLGSLSMLEYNALYPGVLLRIRLRGRDGAVDEAHDWEMFDGVAPLEADIWRRSFTFEVNRPYVTMQEVIARFNIIIRAVTNFANEFGFVNNGVDYYNNAYQFASGSGLQIFQIELTPNGSLRFMGSRVFWANFVIEVPEMKYRYIIFGNDRQYVSLHPITGAEHDPYTIVNVQLQAGGNADLRQTNTFVPNTDGFQEQEIRDANQERIDVHWTADANLLNTLDRRVTIELSCSLPIKNSPMIDHDKEHPDFALARFMFHRAYTLQTDRWAQDLQLHTHDMGAKMLQGPRDRVVFHHLKPQQKIHTLRMRIWARVKTFNELTRKWGMKTIVCPMRASDYWHARLHFVTKL